MTVRLLAVALVACTALAACQRGADTGATSSPNAPGSPGTGNPVTTATPQRGDSLPAGPSGVKGSMAHPGSSGGDAVVGATGSGRNDATGRSQSAQPGSGLNGGLGASSGTAAMGAGPGGTSAMGGADRKSDEAATTAGSSNRTPGGATGARP